MKTQKKNIYPLVPNDQSPLRLTWDSVDYSCAYDSLFKIFYHMWTEDKFNHQAYFEHGTQYLKLLHSNFLSLIYNQCTFENVCDHLRTLLNHNKPLEYCFGRNYTNLDALVRDFTREESWYIQIAMFKMRFYNSRTKEPYSYFQDYTAIGWSSSDCEKLKHTASIQQYLEFKFF